MTHYTVAWDKEVENTYLRAWLASRSQTRRVLTQVADWIDRELAQDPELKGQLLPDLSGRLIDVPLSKVDARMQATYVVSSADRIVRVIRLTFRIE
jgi:hypothetical protein